MENEVEDYLMSHRKSLGVDITFDDLDVILEKCLKQFLQSSKSKTFTVAIVIFFPDS